MITDQDRERLLLLRLLANLRNAEEMLTTIANGGSYSEGVYRDKLAPIRQAIKSGMNTL